MQGMGFSVARTRADIRLLERRTRVAAVTLVSSATVVASVPPNSCPKICPPALQTPAFDLDSARNARSIQRSACDDMRTRANGRLCTETGRFTFPYATAAEMDEVSSVRQPCATPFAHGVDRLVVHRAITHVEARLRRVWQLGVPLEVALGAVESRSRCDARRPASLF